MVLKKIVTVTVRLEGMDLSKLSRWIRCLFQIALPSNLSIAEEILDQAISVCQDIPKVKGSLAIPAPIDPTVGTSPC